MLEAILVFGENGRSQSVLCIISRKNIARKRQ